jgi:DNA-binding beta-propeller fold protein YncE
VGKPKKVAVCRQAMLVCLTIAGCGSANRDVNDAAANADSISQADGRGHGAVLRFVQAIQLPDVAGRFDHFAVDLQRQHLFVAALGNNTLEILDLGNGERLQSIQGFKKPTGIAFVEKSLRIFVGCGEGGSCEILDRDDFHLIQSIKSLPDADNLRYDSGAGHVYVGYGDGALAKIDAETGEHLSDIQLEGHPESFQLESAGSRIFVNVPTAGHVAVLDRLQNAVVDTWPLESARSNFPMALDEGNHRLFVGCRNPASVLVFDTVSGKLITSLTIADDTDDLFYDSAQKRLYVVCGAGFINEFHQSDADHYEATGSIPTREGARTALFVPELRRFYVAVPRRGVQKAEIRIYKVP